MTSLSDKLKSLGVRIGARDLPPPRQRKAQSIERIVPGHLQATPYGDAFVVETEYPLDHCQGRFPLRVKASLRIVAECARELGLATMKRDAFAYLDTETTGLGGGTGTYVFLVGVGRSEGESFHLAQFFMRDPAEERAMLAALTRFLEPCEALVTFNGKAFDAPLLNTRYAINHQMSPLPAFAHLDLLPLARRLWRDRLPSRSLGYLEEHILELPRTEEDVPGWMIPQLYFDYLRDGDGRPLKSVFYHNEMDVLSMAALLGHISGLLDDPCNDRPQDTAVHGLDLMAMGKLFEALGHVQTAVQLYEHSLQRDLPKDAYWKTVWRLSFVHKRHGNLSPALSLWQKAAGHGQIYAHVELAKHYEHAQRDYCEAIRWTTAALDLVRSAAFTQNQRRQWLPELEHRLARLHRKQSRRQQSTAHGTETD